MKPTSCPACGLTTNGAVLFPNGDLRCIVCSQVLNAEPPAPVAKERAKASVLADIVMEWLNQSHLNTCGTGSITEDTDVDRIEMPVTMTDLGGKRHRFLLTVDGLDEDGN